MRQALGKGLEALIPKTVAADLQEPRPAIKIPIEKIRPNHLQPRKNFDPESLSELAASIKEHGLAQPVLVSYDDQTKSYELIAGERRLRAAQLAGLTEIEVNVKSPGSEKERLALALIENLQREDLNPIDTALGYLRLMKEAQINQTQLTKIMSKSKSAISNTLRLLELPENMQKALQFGQMTEGHARAILMIENPIEKQRIFSIVLEQKLSVRATEDIARQNANEDKPKEEIEDSANKAPALQKSPDVRNIEASLQQVLGTKVDIQTRKDGTRGKITLYFYSLTDFDKLVNIIKK